MEPNRLILEAIALRKPVAATYNRQRITIAPHILYTRHDEVYTDAVTIDRDGRPPREVKIGSFKLTGLHEMAVVDGAFDPHPLFDPAEQRYRDTTLFTL